MKKTKKQHIWKKIMGMIIIATLFCSGCGKENKTEQIPKTETNNHSKETEQIEKKEKENYVCFETQYTVEDYCNGVFIVSKSNGLLYGALNTKGEEIIPVKYDEVKFMNKEDIAHNENMDLYLQTRFEDTWSVMDSTGKKQLESNTSLKFNTPLFGNEEKQDFPCFYECGTSSVKLYNELGEMISEVDSSGNIFSADVTWITPEYFLLQTVHSSEEFDATATVGYYKRDGSLVQQWDGDIKDKKCLENEFALWVLDYDEVCKFSIDNNGNINELERVNIDDYIKVKQDDFVSGAMNHANGTETYYLADGVQLYQSNGTWKLCDADGNALYDERYFDCNLQGDYDAFFLQNEDLEVLVVDSAGKKLVDYGMVTYNDASQTYSFNGVELNWNNNYFVDKHSICFVTSNDGMTKVYCYGEI